ncbi:hypothetical protein L1987_33741 [Smallanthus sonchifolius]|uniref:Uncharacterized protein n=1 Tax=Smallanthus sonchifolius TaxID=185202 RepID=A0ACB9HRP6_9ASTR|nr:hypothetical protein L1987_33741 [Smallanthus sonchifolius]
MPMVFRARRISGFAFVDLYAAGIIEKKDLLQTQFLQQSKFGFLLFCPPLLTSVSANPRTVEVVFRDFKGRRLIKAVTTGRAVSKKEITDIIQKFNIQVNNLTQ